MTNNTLRDLALELKAIHESNKSPSEMDKAERKAMLESSRKFEKKVEEQVSNYRSTVRLSM